ncbi:MAG TPA: cytochrome c [Gemmatimonadetes bacterium]|nr:cytochrome c [Gemmatimonadota bacterium]
MSKRAGAALVAGVILITAVALLLPRLSQERRAQERAMAAQFYQGRCAMCHEVEGGIGPRLDARVLASYGTAQRLFNYIRLAMPYGAPRTLSNEEYWRSVGHLLRSRGLVPEDAVVNGETAEGISLEAGAS